MGRKRISRPTYALRIGDEDGPSFIVYLCWNRLEPIPDVLTNIEEVTGKIPVIFEPGQHKDVPPNAAIVLLDYDMQIVAVEVF